MPYPLEDRFKNLQEQVANQQEPTYDGHPIDDKVYHGVVLSVTKDSPYNYAYLHVCPYDPYAPDQAGNLTFEHLTDDPLRNSTTSTRYDKVYVTNLAPQLAYAYYQPGQRIVYWQYSGTLANTALIRGTYVTLWTGPSTQVLKATSNATGSGVYNGRILGGVLQNLDPAVNLALPGTMTLPPADNCYIINPAEQGISGSHTLTTPSFVTGLLVGNGKYNPGDPTLPVYSLTSGTGGGHTFAIVALTQDGGSDGGSGVLPSYTYSFTYPTGGTTTYTGQKAIFSLMGPNVPYGRWLPVTTVVATHGWVWIVGGFPTLVLTNEQLGFSECTSS
jgi:hypothetical protein